MRLSRPLPCRPRSSSNPESRRSGGKLWYKINCQYRRLLWRSPARTPRLLYKSRCRRRCKVLLLNFRVGGVGEASFFDGAKAPWRRYHCYFRTARNFQPASVLPAASFVGAAQRIWSPLARSVAHLRTFRDRSATLRHAPPQDTPPPRCPRAKTQSLAQSAARSDGRLRGGRGRSFA